MRHLERDLGSQTAALCGRSVLSDSCSPGDRSQPGFSGDGDYPGKNSGVSYHSLLQGIFPTQGSNPGLPTEPPRKPENTGVGGLSLLQRIFLTQESN